jgi:hypothetical protein
VSRPVWRSARIQQASPPPYETTDQAPLGGFGHGRETPRLATPRDGATTTRSQHRRLPEAASPYNQAMRAPGAAHVQGRRSAVRGMYAAPRSTPAHHPWAPVHAPVRWAAVVGVLRRPPGQTGDRGVTCQGNTAGGEVPDGSWAAAQGGCGTADRRTTRSGTPQRCHEPSRRIPASVSGVRVGQATRHHERPGVRDVPTDAGAAAPTAHHAQANGRGTDRAVAD